MLQQYVKEAPNQEEKDKREKTRSDVEKAFNDLKTEVETAKKTKSDDLLKRLDEIKDEIANATTDEELVKLREKLDGIDKEIEDFLTTLEKTAYEKLGKIFTDGLRNRFPLDKQKIEGAPDDKIDKEGSTLTLEQSKYNGISTKTGEPKQWGLAVLMTLQPKVCQDWKFFQMVRLDVTYNGNSVNVSPTKPPKLYKQPVVTSDGWEIDTTIPSNPFYPYQRCPGGITMFDTPGVPEDFWTKPGTKEYPKPWVKKPSHEKITVKFCFMTWILCIKPKVKILGYVTWGYTLTIINGTPDQNGVVPDKIEWHPFKEDAPDANYEYYKRLLEKAKFSEYIPKKE